MTHRASPVPSAGSTPGAWAWGDNNRDEIVPWLPTSATKALDVGCGLGAFGEEMKRRWPHAEVHGVEPTADAAVVAGSRLDGVTCGLFPNDLPDDWSGYDVITFNDSLEHMPDPWDALARAAALLADGGKIIASLPNVRFLDVSINLLFRGRWAYQESGVLDRTHLRFFTRSTMVEMFEGAGLEVENVVALHVKDGATHLTARTLQLFGSTFEPLLALQYLIVGRVRPG